MNHLKAFLRNLLFVSAWGLVGAILAAPVVLLITHHMLIAGIVYAVVVVALVGTVGEILINRSSTHEE